MNLSNSQERIVKHYSGAYSELDRLTAETLGQIEFTRTCQILERHLPEAKEDGTTTILDIGGGPGTYSMWLLERGYSVHLVDPVQKHIEQAESRFGTNDKAQAHLGCATNLAMFGDSSADGMLFFGPLYHLTDYQDRQIALKEAYRVLKPKSFLFGAAISRFASLLDGLDRRFMFDPDFEIILDQDLKDGQHRNSTGNIDYWTDAFLHEPKGLVDEVEAAGFVNTRVLMVEGPLWANKELEEDWKDEKRRDLMLKYAERVEEEEALIGMSPHLLVVSEKP